MSGGLSFYKSIWADHSPCQYGVDDQNRVLYSLNFSIDTQGTVVTLEEDIASLLVVTGLSTYTNASPASVNLDTFIGPSRTIPTGDGPYMSIIDNTGPAPDIAQGGEVYDHRSLQIIVRATNYIDARTRAQAVYSTLNGLFNITV